MMGSRTAPCPNCGAPIGFGLASSPAKVCEFCNFVVIRSDQGFRSTGKMADLVPTASPFEVNDTISVEARRATVAGRSQRDWGMGPWDEFYVAFDDGTTAWLAQAQGNWYVTSRVDPTGTSLSTWDSAAVGMRDVRLGSDPRPWMINEKRKATLIAAKGEFDTELSVGDVSHYLDLSASGNGFATADFGNLQEPPSLYVGVMLASNAVALVSAALGARPEQKVDVSRMQCPHCGAPVPLFVPSETQRAICSSCGASLNATQGKLELLGILDLRNKAMPTIPLGTQGSLRGTDYVVIGYLRRFTVVEGDRYYWGEYLLHSANGYTWLVEDNGQFMLTRTISNADVSQASWGGGVVYEGKTFKRFFDNQAHVDAVVGEFYWKVEIGETVRACDFIAPPRVVSVEYGADEIITSVSEHVSSQEVSKAFSVTLENTNSGAVAAPNPYKLMWPALLCAGGLIAMIVIGVIHGGRFPNETVITSLPLNIDPKTTALGNPFAAPTTPSDPSRSITYSPPFTVRRGPTTLAVTLTTDATNVWVGGDCAMINEDNGEVIEFNVDVGQYRGYTEGENWSEGSNTNTEYVTRVHSGHYSVRCATDWETYSGSGSSAPMPVPPSATLSAVVNEHGIGSGLCAFLILILPFGLGVYLKFQYEQKRWENSNVN